MTTFHLVRNAQHGYEIQNNSLLRKEVWLAVHANVEWAAPMSFQGPPSRGKRKHYPAFKKDGITYRLGDCVYLRGQRNVPHDISRIEAAWENRNGVKMGRFRKFYRLEEAFPLVESSDRTDDTGEVFASDEFVEKSLAMVVGKCHVKHHSGGSQDVFPSGRKKDCFYYCTWYDPRTGEMYEKLTTPPPPTTQPAGSIQEGTSLKQNHTTET